MAKKTHSLAAVAYILTWLTGLIVYFVAEKKDKYTKFHAAQAIVLGIALMIITFIFKFIPYLSLAIYIIPVVICAVKAYNRERFKIPLIGDLAEMFLEKV